MGHFCYASKVLPGKANAVREHWQNKPSTLTGELEAAEDAFFAQLKMTHFDSWLQQTSQGEFMIHSLEGDSLESIFTGLREAIKNKNPIALKLQAFYQDVLGKDYLLKEVEPHIELLLDLSLPKPKGEKTIKKAFCQPLLPHKEEEHRRFRKESMTSKKEHHLKALKAFGVFKLSVWLQSIGNEKRIVIYTECLANPPQNAESSPEWQEISKMHMEHYGVSYDELIPEVEWLTEPAYVT